MPFAIPTVHMHTQAHKLSQNFQRAGLENLRKSCLKWRKGKFFQYDSSLMEAPEGCYGEASSSECEIKPLSKENLTAKNYAIFSIKQKEN